MARKKNNPQGPRDDDSGQDPGDTAEIPVVTSEAVGAATAALLEKRGNDEPTAVTPAPDVFPSAETTPVLEGTLDPGTGEIATAEVANIPGQERGPDVTVFVGQDDGGSSEAEPFVGRPLDINTRRPCTCSHMLALHTEKPPYYCVADRCDCKTFHLDK